MSCWDKKNDAQSLPQVCNKLIYMQWDTTSAIPKIKEHLDIQPVHKLSTLLTFSILWL